MKIDPKTRAIRRYIALDIHKEYVLAGGMNAIQEAEVWERMAELGIAQ